MRQKRFPSLWYVRRKPCTYLTSTLTPSPNGPNEIPRDPHHLGVPSGVIPLDRAGVPDLSVSGG